MSFCSRTLIMTRLGPSARNPGDSEMIARRTSERRNIMEFLLRIANLSRRNCYLRLFGGEVDLREPLPERGERNIKESQLKHGEKRHGDELSVLNREPNKVRKVEPERHLHDRE